MMEVICELYPSEEILLADGFDEAILGIDDLSGRVVYSIKKCIDVLEKNMTRDEAYEYFMFNMYGSYVGEQTPIWCNDLILDYV